MLKTTLTLALACGLLVGCDTKGAKNGKTATPKKRVAKVTPGGWTEKPTAASIPEGAIKGTANGAAFECKEVYFEPSMGKWNMYVVDSKLKTPTGFTPQTAQYVNVSFKEAPAAGKVLTKKLGLGDGFFQVNDAKLKNTTSWNSYNAYHIEITKWDVKGYNEKGDMFQQAGTASGKVYVSYKGSGDFKNSVVAGTFENAIVRYMGKPDLES